MQSESQPPKVKPTDDNQQSGEKSEEPSAKKGKPELGSHDSPEPMETESCDQVSERGQPMEADVANQNVVNGQVAKTENIGTLIVILVKVRFCC